MLVPFFRDAPKIAVAEGDRGRAFLYVLYRGAFEVRPSSREGFHEAPTDALVGAQVCCEPSACDLSHEEVEIGCYQSKCQRSNFLPIILRFKTVLSVEGGLAFASALGSQPLETANWKIRVEFSARCIAAFSCTALSPAPCAETSFTLGGFTAKIGTPIRLKQIPK